MKTGVTRVSDALSRWQAFTAPCEQTVLAGLDSDSASTNTLDCVDPEVFLGKITKNFREWVGPESSRRSTGSSPESSGNSYIWDCNFDGFERTPKYTTSTADTVPCRRPLPRRRWGSDPDCSTPDLPFYRVNQSLDSAVKGTFRATTPILSPGYRVPPPPHNSPDTTMSQRRPQPPSLQPQNDLHRAIIGECTAALTDALARSMQTQRTILHDEIRAMEERQNDRIDTIKREIKLIENRRVTAAEDLTRLEERTERRFRDLLVGSQDFSLAIGDRITRELRDVRDGIYCELDRRTNPGRSLGDTDSRYPPSDHQLPSPIHPYPHSRADPRDPPQAPPQPLTSTPPAGPPPVGDPNDWSPSDGQLLGAYGYTPASSRGDAAPASGRPSASSTAANQGAPPDGPPSRARHYDGNGRGSVSGGIYRAAQGAPSPNHGPPLSGSYFHDGGAPLPAYHGPAKPRCVCTP